MQILHWAAALKLDRSVFAPRIYVAPPAGAGFTLTLASCIRWRSCQSVGIPSHPPRPQRPETVPGHPIKTMNILHCRSFLLASLICAAIPVPLVAAPGGLDLSFGGSGIVIVTVPGQTSTGRAVSVQSDGKIVVGSSGGAVRLTQNGSLDVTFAGTGRVSAGFGGSFFTTGLALGTDGKVILVGYVSQPDGFAVARFDEDGFNFGNILTPGIGNGEDVALQSDGKIVVVGNRGYGFTVARYKTNGVLDNGFDGDGQVGFALDYGSNAYGVAVQSDGKIVVVGSISLTNTIGSPDFMVMRLNPNGSPDTSFGGVGYVNTPVGPGGDYAYAVAIQADDKILVAGYYSSATGADLPDYALLRYNADGSLYTSFNGTGKKTANISQRDVTTGMAVQSDGKILVAGESGIVRFTANGSLDSSFGASGKVATAYTVTGIAVQPDGQIVTSGENGNGILVARYHSGTYPGLVVEQPLGNQLTNGQSPPPDFGTITLGQNAALSFSIRNQGWATSLSGLAVNVTGGAPGEYTVSALGSTVLATGQSTTFAVTFAPAAPGTRNATLRIASNDPDDNPFVIQVTGTGATKMEAWRKAHFGSYDNDGPGADQSDPDNDGMVNFMEYALSTDPLAFTAPIGELAKNGDSLEFTYTRPKASLVEVRYGLEASASMSGLWINAGTTTTILSDDGLVQHVKETTATSAFGKRFVRLRITKL